MPKIIAAANRALPDRRFVFGTLPEYIEHLRKSADLARLEVVRGELRDGPPQSVSANALATRIFIKQLNKQAENALLRRAEPLCCLTAMLGAEYPRTLLNLAWQHLLLAHPHDSINGVTQDKTADDAVYRIRQALEIAGALHENAVAELIRRIDFSAYSPDDMLLVLVNPLAWPVRDVVKLCVDTPQERNVWDFDVLDEAGRPVAIQREGRQEKTSPVHDLAARPWPFYLDRHTIHLETGEIPAGGYRVPAGRADLDLQPQGGVLGRAAHEPRRRHCPNARHARKRVPQGRRRPQRHARPARQTQRPVVLRAALARGQRRRGRLLDLLSALREPHLHQHGEPGARLARRQRPAGRHTGRRNRHDLAGLCRAAGKLRPRRKPAQRGSARAADHLLAHAEEGPAAVGSQDAR